ncbi:hypothetical protein [uncultured Paracoccus sp.]|uniref:phage adaptor protein n=1 Tax=uncultured Paracoccus sp. TaxID=189685 RepID=UPI0030DAF27A|tara:strand:- start:6425 stop:7087 length:663 start_codon:yes stop_codon:yes gene_type:complete
MTVVFAHLDGLLPISSPQANGCPAFILSQAARLAAVEFCERTRCWRHLASFDAAEPVTAEIIPTEAVIWEIEEASANGQPLTPVQHTDAALKGGSVGIPRYISQTNPWGVLVHPFPETGPVTVEMSVFLKPRSDKIVGIDNENPLLDGLNVVPDWMMQQHSERLADGALSRVLMMEGQRWYNPQRAAYHRALFDSALRRNFAANMRGQQRAPIRMPTSYM